MPAEEELLPEIIADRLAEALDADVVFCNGPVNSELFGELVTSCSLGKKYHNIFLVLVTFGGDAHTAYRIGRFLQGTYKKITIYIPSFCKSAGTLIAISGHEIVISKFGELGPLDVQLYKRDEITQVSSGATIFQALSALEERSFQFFERYVLEISGRTNGNVTFRTASQLSVAMTIGLYQEIFGQIDPVNVGEMHRDLCVALEYGVRLAEISKNTDHDRVKQLVYEYPDHSFVIDETEARKLFTNVRKPNRTEIQLTMALKELAINPLRSEVYVEVLSGKSAGTTTETECIFNENAKEEGSALQSGDETFVPGQEQEDERSKGATERADDGKDGELRSDAGQIHSCSGQ